MIRIGKSYIKRDEEEVKLCADISIDNHRATLWYGVPKEYESSLALSRADAFVVALLPTAMRTGRNIICEDALSEALHYQITRYLIPCLKKAGHLYQEIEVEAPLTTSPYDNEEAVGTGFSGGVDCLYTIMRHQKDSLYPLTHIVVFNSGVFDRETYREDFFESYELAKKFASENKLKALYVDTNFLEVLPERFLDVYTFRNLSCALVLQGLFKMYYLSSGHDAANFSFDLHNSASYDALTVWCLSTEGLIFYLSGYEVKRRDKIEALTKWKPSYHWLHPCVYGKAGEVNCGHCKKCTRDITTIYALGKLECYKKVIDVEQYKKFLPQKLGFILANRGNHLYDETLELLEQKHIEIPPVAYMLEKQFTKSLENLKNQKEES